MRKSKATCRQAQRVCTLCVWEPAFTRLCCWRLHLEVLSLSEVSQPPSLETSKKCWGGPQGGRCPLTPLLKPMEDS